MSRRNKVVGYLVGILALSGTASAADLNNYKSAPASPETVAPMFSWTGFYVGGFGGGYFGRSNSVNTAGTISTTVSPGGPTIGGFVGFNYQLSSFVLGAEAEGGWIGANASTNYVNPAIVANVSNYRVAYDWESRIRGRVGYAFDHFLPFIAGGVSFSNTRVTYVGLTFNSNGAPSIDKSETGWNLGGGVDWAIDNHWIVRAEYIHDEYGRWSFPFGNISNSFTNRRISTSADSVRAAVSYKF